jgi:tetratricopeptide (TPR) repeat protein
MSEDNEEYNAFLDRDYDQFNDLYDEANDLFTQDQFDESLEVFADALKLIPEPKADWEETSVILSGIADIWFVKKDYQVCLDALTDALQCPGADEIAHLHFRMGQAYYELKDIPNATESLYKAHILNEDIFENESDIYFNLLIDREK